MKIGYARTDVTPPIGVDIQGYFRVRTSIDVLDNLYAHAAVIESSQNKIAMVSCDLIGIGANYIKRIKDIVTQKTDLKANNILIHATHTHTGPLTADLLNETDKSIKGEPDAEYLSYMVRQVASAIIMADLNKKQAVFGTAEGYEDSVAFIRRYKMKDGTIKTNPGVGNPDIVAPVGEIDPKIDLLNFKYTDGSGSLLFVSYSLHPDIVGGVKFSAGFPGALRRKVQKAIPGCKVMFFNGAQGDINHVDAMHKGRTSKGYEYATKVGNILAGDVIKSYENITYHDDCEVDGFISTVSVPLRQFSKEDYEIAMNTIDAYTKGKSKEKGMMKTTSIARALRIQSLYNGGKSKEMDITVVKVGNTGIVGLPGEPFIGISNKIIKDSPAENTLVLCLVNGSTGYLPVAEAYAEGGYEANNSPFTSELEGILEESALEGLNKLFSNS